MSKRPPQHQAYRPDSDVGQGPDLVTCGVYFFGCLLIGAVILYLVLKLGGNL